MNLLSDPPPEVNVGDNVMDAGGRVWIVAGISDRGAFLIRTRVVPLRHVQTMTKFHPGESDATLASDEFYEVTS